MKKNLLCAIALSAAFFASCDIIEFPQKFEDESDVPITFGAVEECDFDLQTKAGPSQVALSTFSTFNVYCSTFSNLAFSTKDNPVTTSSVFASSTQKYYPYSGSLTFYASNAASVTGSTLTTSSIDRDLVWATASGSKSNTSGVTLAFKHAYTQIAKCSISGTNTTGGTVTVNSVKITPRTKGTLDLGTGEWSSTSAGSEQILTNNGSTDNDLWLIPDTYTITVAYTVTQGDYTNTRMTSGTVALDAGRNNSLAGAFSITESGITQVRFNVTVEAWSDKDVAVTFGS